MKQMKKTHILLLLLLLSALNMYGQNGVKQNVQATTTGKIEIPVMGTVTPVQADYSLAVGLNQLSLTIDPLRSFQFGARIVDANGKEVQKLRSEMISGKHTSAIDITSLRPGKYFIEMFGDNYGKNYRIPFTKSAS